MVSFGREAEEKTASFTVVYEMFDSPHHPQGLQLSNSVVPLGRLQCSAGKGDWLQETILSLGEHGPKAYTRGIRF